MKALIAILFFAFTLAVDCKAEKPEETLSIGTRMATAQSNSRAPSEDPSSGKNSRDNDEENGIEENKEEHEWETRRHLPQLNNIVCLFDFNIHCPRAFPVFLKKHQSQRSHSFTTVILRL